MWAVALDLCASIQALFHTMLAYSSVDLAYDNRVRLDSTLRHWSFLWSARNALTTSILPKQTTLTVGEIVPQDIPGYGMRPYVTNSVSRIPKLHTSDFIENLL